MRYVGKLVSFEELSKEEQRLLRAAKRAIERAYTPYFKFPVGAAVLTTTGEAIAGTNFEVAAAGDSICAERAALLRANAQGHGAQCWKIAVVTRSRDSPTAPCGSCLQMIHESAQRSEVGSDFGIILATFDFRKIRVTTIGKLLPLAFGPKDLLEENNKELLKTKGD